MLRKTDLLGYIDNSEYTYQFFGDWSPTILTLACLQRGIKPPKIKIACELGFGQGISMNLLACANEIDWFGTDFNQRQAQFSSDLSKLSNNNASIYNFSFEEFSLVENLPKFDLIVVHGILSWVPVENQKILSNFIHDHISDNGLVFISYNSRPGSDAFKPAQYLMNKFRRMLTVDDCVPEELMKTTLNWMNDLHKVNPAYLNAFPVISTRMELIKNQDLTYLVHEFFNDVWATFYFSEMANIIGSGLSYLGQSNYLDDVVNLNFTADQLNFINSITDDSLKQDVKDSIVNRQFRKDLWIKSPIKITSEELSEFVNSSSVILNVDPSKIDFSFHGARYKVTINQESYRKLIFSLSGFDSKSLFSLKKYADLNDLQIVEAITLLSSKGWISLSKPQDEIVASKNKCFEFNKFVIKNRKYRINALASPVTGGAIAISDEILFLMLEVYIDGYKNRKDFKKAFLKAISRLDVVNVSDNVDSYIQVFYDKVLVLFKAHHILQ